LADLDGGTMTEESKAYWSAGRGFDMRHVPGPVYLTVEGKQVPHQAVWLRPFDPLRPVDGLTDAQRDLAALAYVCDYTILEPVLRVLGLAWAMPGLITASLDHAMWFHRPGPVDGWLLYVQEAAAADAGRGLGTGRFYTRDHRHLATVAQEGMLRSA
jgi:acyl-CoA thioesterase-2